MKNIRAESFLPFSPGEKASSSKPLVVQSATLREITANTQQMGAIRAYIESEGSIDGVENSSRIDATWRGIAI